MNTEIDSAVQDLSNGDAVSLYAKLGAYSSAFSKDPTLFASPGATVQVDASVAGPLDYAIDLGKRILDRWKRTIYDLVCGTNGLDPEAKEAKQKILGALKHRHGWPDAENADQHAGDRRRQCFRRVKRVLFGKVLLPAAGEEVCAFWKERL